METIEDKDVFSVECYHKNDYVDDLDEINNLMLGVVASYEYNNENYDFDEAKQYLYDLNNDFFQNDNIDARLYVLKNKMEERPVCFALFSHDNERNDWHLEYVCTHQECSGMGFAELLLKICTKEIAKTDFPTITSVVKKTNEPSIRLHNSLARVSGIEFSCCELDDYRYSYSIGFQKIKNDSINKDIDEMMF